MMLFREIYKSKSQFLAASAVIFFGITLFMSSYISYFNLKNSVECFYEKNKFLHYYAEARNITPEAINKIKAMAGVASAEGRICSDISAFMDDGRKVSLKLISLPDNRRPKINDILILNGSYFNSPDKNLCIVSDKFAQFNKISRGSKLKCLINLKLEEFKVCAAASAPEFAIALKSPETPLNGDYGIIYIKDETAREMFGYENSYNQVLVRFMPGADHYAAIDKIEKLLKPYGFMNGTERKKQFSFMIISEEIKNLQRTAVIFPSIFLIVAGIIIYVMQKRLVNNQRTLIGVMKAFGYSDLSILFYYVKYSLSIAMAGALPAVAAGYYLGGMMLYAYNQVFSIPDLNLEMYWRVAFISVLISCSFCLAAGYNSAKRAVRIVPAQAMRVESPESGHSIFLENIKTIWNELTFSHKMIARNIFRNKQRSLLTIFGISMTIMFFMISLFFVDSIDFAFNSHFFDFQRQDYKIVFSKPVHSKDAFELSSVRGVLRNEPCAALPVEVIKGYMKKETMLVAASPENAFYRLINENKERILIPEKGILIPHMIAESFGIKPGDKITIKACIGNLKVKESSREIKKDVTVAGIAKQYAGADCYMSLRGLNEFMEEGNFVTQTLIKAEQVKSSAIRKKIKDMSGVESIERRTDAYDAFMEQMKFMKIFVTIMIIFGSVMGFSIIFNSTVINITERARELASLKVLGYSNDEIFKALFIENIALWVMAILPGMAFGRVMCGIINKAFSNDMFSLELIIYPRTYLMTIAGVLLCVILAQLATKRNIRRLDMVEVLKSRE